MHLVTSHKSCTYPLAAAEQYLDMILKAWGDWTLFQQLLSILRTIGDRHGGVSIANVATRWVLDYPCVGAVIIGKRHPISSLTPHTFFHPPLSLLLFHLGIPS